MPDITYPKPIASEMDSALDRRPLRNAFDALADSNRTVAEIHDLLIHLGDRSVAAPHSKEWGEEDDF